MVSMLIISVLTGALPAPPPDSPSHALHAEFRAVRQAERVALEALVLGLERTNRLTLAAAVRAAIEPEDGPGPIRFRPFPEVVPPAGKGAAAVSTERGPGLPEEAVAIRLGTARALFAIAGRAAASKVHRFALADRCLRGVLERDPNHAEARRLLGFLPYRGGWATPHAVDLMERGYVLHPTFGWVEADWVPHLDRGELPGEFTSTGKARSWLPASEADELHRSFSRGWQIKTAPHFEIQTDVRLADAVAFGRRLEDLHELFLSQFADLIGPDLPLARRAANRDQKPVATTIRHQVAYFADKAEYVDYFKTHFFQDESLSLGYYMPPSQARLFPKTKPRSYFYRDDANAIASHATLYHEGSHQILFETARNGAIDEKRPNYWIWEGLGTYFETVTPQKDGSILVGGLVGPRIALARQLSEADELEPLKDFLAMNKPEFNAQEDDAVYRNYAQAMALAVFLLHGEDGRYREDFLDFVADAYRGRRVSLPERLGVASPTLATQFRDYLK